MSCREFSQGFFPCWKCFLTQPKKQEVFSIGQVFQILRTKAVIIDAFPYHNFFADSLAPSFLQTLESCLKRIKLICTSENESKDQIGDSCTIFVTVLHKDAKKFCLANKECFQAYKTGVNPSKICCKSTFALSFDRH